MPRETIDSILEEEESVDVLLIEEEEEISDEFELYEPCMSSPVVVDLSVYDIRSSEELHNSPKRDDAFELLQEEYDVVRIYDGELMNYDDTFWCILNEDRYSEEVSRSVIDGSGDMIQVHEDSDDLIFCSDDDETYIDSCAADNNDVYYCDGCEEYRHSNNHNFDNCENGGDEGNGGSTFDNSSVASEGQKMSKYARDRGTMSTTFTNTNGMRYTFGVEVETSGGYVPTSEGNDLNVSAVNDGSISGKEYVTGVLVGDSGLSMLKKVCDTVQENCEIDSQCGIHVHIGGATFNRRFTIMATHLGLMLQDEVFEMMPPSRKRSTYCKPIPTKHKEMTFKNYKEHLADLIYSSCTLDADNNKKTRLGRYPSKRYTWLNMVGYSQANGHNTIEFRNHGASMNYEKIRNWTLICMAFVNFVENNQRRIWEARNLPGGITLDEVLHSALGDNLGGQVSRYVNSRKDKFNGAI